MYMAEEVVVEVVEGVIFLEVTLEEELAEAVAIGVPTLAGDGQPEVMAHWETTLTMAMEEAAILETTIITAIITTMVGYLITTIASTGMGLVDLGDNQEEEAEPRTEAWLEEVEELTI